MKGHGTENDFILLPDLENAWEPTDSQVRALCDRRAGLGADGLIRIATASSPGTGFFMDYRNADGSLAEMCGNGARVFARYLVDAGWQQPGSFEFGTRGGVRTASLGATGDVSIGMGPAVVGSESKAELFGRPFTGLAVDVGNPHLVCLLQRGAGDDLAGLDLTRAPTFDSSVFPTGVNVEFVVPVAPDHIRMRVYERGVGETRSCGTGTVAAAAAFLATPLAATLGTTLGTTRTTTLGTMPATTPGTTPATMRIGGDEVRVDVPGGSVTVTFAPDGATLTGPAVIVATGTIDREFWDLHR